MAPQSLVTLVYQFPVDADNAEQEVETVLSGALSPFDFAGVTVGHQIDAVDTDDEEATYAEVIHLYGEGGRYASDPSGLA